MDEDKCSTCPSALDGKCGSTLPRPSCNQPCSSSLLMENNSGDNRKIQDEKGRQIVRNRKERHRSQSIRQRRSLSSRLLLLIILIWLLIVLTMIIIPESQGLFIYLSWVKWPYFRDLNDLVSFRLPHARNIKIQTSDEGVVLGAWHILPSHQIAAEASKFVDYTSPERNDFFDDALGQSNARIVIYFHGNAATRGQFNRVEAFKALSSMLQAHVIAVDYRGFADSTGWPSEEGLGKDAQAVWDWVGERVSRRAKTKEKEECYQTPRVYIYGQSLGTTVALKLAYNLHKTKSCSSNNASTLSTQPTGIILDAPFTNLTTAVLHHPSALPFRIIPFIRVFLLKALYEEHPSIEYIQQIPHPILIFHGHKDRMIPFHIGLELYQAAQLARLRSAPHLLEDVWFSELPHASHNNIYAFPQWLHDLHSFMKAMEN